MLYKYPQSIISFTIKDSLCNNQARTVQIFSGFEFINLWSNIEYLKLVVYEFGIKIQTLVYLPLDTM